MWPALSPSLPPAACPLPMPASHSPPPALSLAFVWSNVYGERVEESVEKLLIQQMTGWICDDLGWAPGALGSARGPPLLTVRAPPLSSSFLP